MQPAIQIEKIVSRETYPRPCSEAPPIGILEAWEFFASKHGLNKPRIVAGNRPIYIQQTLYSQYLLVGSSKCGKRQGTFQVWSHNDVVRDQFVAWCHWLAWGHEFDGCEVNA